jgi:predicted RNA-binding protein with PIN domain
MSRWIVDGMNVIGSRPNGWWRDRPGAMRALVEELEAFAERGGEGVTVVFDGKPFDLESGSVEVMFASRRGPNAADDDIAALVRRNDDPGGLSVVTSDGDLAGRVRAAGAAVVGAGEFRRRLDTNG